MLHISPQARARIDFRPQHLDMLRKISAASTIYFVRGKWRTLGGAHEFEDKEIADLDRMMVLRAPPEPGDGIGRRVLSEHGRFRLRLAREGRGP